MELTRPTILFSNLVIAILICGICQSSKAELSPQFLFGHPGPVLAIAFSFDEKWLASGGSNTHEIRVQDLSTDNVIHTLVGHTGRITDLAFGSNGQLISSSEDRTVRLWDVETRSEIRQFNDGVGQQTKSVDVSPDGEFLIFGSSDRTLKLWEVNSGTLLRTFEGHQDIVLSVAFSPDGQIIASGSADHTVRLWNVSDGSLIKTFVGHTDRIWAIAFHPSGTQLASGAWDGTVRIWNVDESAEQIDVPFAVYDRQVLSVEFSPDARLLAIGLVNSESDNTIKLWDVVAQRELRSFDTKSKHDLAFGPNRSWLATAGTTDGAITIWHSNPSLPQLLEPESGIVIEVPEAILKWEAIENSVYYDVEIAQDSDFVQNPQLITLTENQLTFPIEDDIPQYWWRVRTGGFGQVSEWSDVNTFLTPFEPPPTCAVRILPPRRRVNLGDEFGVQIAIESVSDLAGFQFNLHWTNPEVLSFVTVTQFAKIFDLEQQLPNADERFFQVDQENGFFRNVVATTFGQGSVSGGGVLLAVLFKAETIGSSDIELQEVLLVNSSGTKTIRCNVFNARVTVENPARPWDVNRDGVVDILDLRKVAQFFGERITTVIEDNPDINGDGIVDLFDITSVGSHFGEIYDIGESAPAAPSLIIADLQLIKPRLEQIYTDLLSVPDNSPAFARTREILHQLLLSFIPQQDVLLQNYPNPFNPETWLPFQLASVANVTIDIHDVHGVLVRRLSLGNLPPGSYMNRTNAAYWNGMNAHGEPVASGVYFYTISTGSFRATKKMTVSK